jgi:hypothetical protein
MSGGVSGLATCGAWLQRPFEVVVSKPSSLGCPDLLSGGGGASSSCLRDPPSMGAGCVVSSASPSAVQLPLRLISGISVVGVGVLQVV